MKKKNSLLGEMNCTPKVLCLTFGVQFTSAINLYAEEALLSASRTINIGNNAVGADASLSNRQDFGQDDWSDTEEEF